MSFRRLCQWIVLVDGDFHPTAHHHSDVLVGCSRDTNAPRMRQSLQTRGDVHPIPEQMSAHVRTPSIVPEPSSETVYLVLDGFGRLGRAYVETDERETKMEHQPVSQTALLD